MIKKTQAATNFARIALGCVVLSVVTLPTQAAINQCTSTAAAGNQISAYNSTVNGCFEVDQQFVSFGTTNSSGTAPPDATAINFLGVAPGTYNAAAKTLTGVSVSLVSAGWNISGTSNNTSMTSVIDMETLINTTAQPTAKLAAQTLSVASATGFAGSDTASVRMDVCYGAAAAITTANFATGCTAASGALEFILFSYTGSTTAVITGSESSALLNAPANIIAWATRVTVVLNQDYAKGNSAISFSGVGISYNESGFTPEPGTFGLLGSSLIGLVFLEARRRRKS